MQAPYIPMLLLIFAFVNSASGEEIRPAENPDLFRVLNLDAQVLGSPESVVADKASRCEVAEGGLGLDNEWEKECRSAAHQRRIPEFPAPPQEVLGITPYSKRAIAFAQHYQKMSEALHPYLGEPKVITSLAFESHVVKNVAEDLWRLERAIDLAKRLKAIQSSHRVDLSSISSDLRQLLKTPEMRRAMERYGLMPFVENPPWKWGWKHLDKIIDDLTGVYENMAAMNMHIFSYMTSPEYSPLVLYFNKVKQCDPSFKGRMSFPDDPNGILSEAFQRLYLLRQSKDLKTRQRLSFEFSTLLIAHEQLYAQTYYDRIQSEHKKLAGLFKVRDPLGEYQLANASWADFRVRFSLDPGQPFDASKIKAGQLLVASPRAGTIPDYYKTRIFSRDATKMLARPDFTEIQALIGVPTQTHAALLNNRALEVMHKHGCLGCHSLGKIESGGVVGPNLGSVGKFLDRQAIYRKITDPRSFTSTRCPGGGCPAGVMPANFRDTISPEDLDVLADFLANQKQ